jgi:hypothetical protein
MAKNTCKAVAALVAFQKTGTGFDEVWVEIHGIVDEFPRIALVRNGARAKWVTTSRRRTTWFTRRPSG